ncbi:MAG: DUF4349 domain-containing protein [Chloroflexota bacterium]|nr:DUF4349 domain-containing protein [Chloroflexota bacterium]
MRRVLLLLLVLLLAIAACASPGREASQVANMGAPFRGESFEDVEMAPEPMADEDMAESVILGMQDEPIDRQIIYRGDLSLVVLNPAQSMAQVESIAESFGGYVASSHLGQYRGDLMRGSVTIRVPADRYRDAMAQLSSLAERVLSENRNTEDVTAEFTDLEARLRNLEAAETELLALLEEVRERPGSTAEDILDVFNEVTRKRGEIEQTKGRMQYLSNLVALATISVELLPDEVTKPLVDEEWQPLVTVKNAFRSLIGVLQGLIDFLINFVIVLLPVLILLAVPVVLIILLIRWIRRRRSETPS